MGIVEQFKEALAGTVVAGDVGPASLPIRLASACVQVLPATGAGLSLFSGPTMRIPVGASDDVATVAERLQFTFAEGPCFTANETGERVIGTETVMAQRWPLFYEQLVARTPIRGVLSTPLTGGLVGLGVLDLYVHDGADLAAIDSDEVDLIVGYIAEALTTEPMFPEFGNGPPWDGPLWAATPQAGARGNVLIAMGMVSVAQGLRLDDALAALRAYAFAVDRTVDAVASDVVHRILPTTALAIDANS
jgi:hypothetical protein